MTSFFKRGKKKKKKNIGVQYKEQLYTSLQENIDYIKEKTGNSDDIIVRTLKVGKDKQHKMGVIYISAINDEQKVNEFIVQNIIQQEQRFEGSQDALIEQMENVGVAIGEVKMIDQWADLFTALMNGNALLFIDGVPKALNCSTKGGERRSVEEPTSQVTIRGPKDGFTEIIETNIALVRRRIKNPALWVETMEIGTLTKTKVKMMFLNGVANEKVVKEVRKRLKKVKMDSILESGYIEEMIQDEAKSVFPTNYHSERPDVVAGNILEGRIAIFVDGTPFVLIAPAVFIQFFQASEDYYARADIASALRFLRIQIFMISIIAPSFYIAATTFHQEMIPTDLLMIIAAQRESVPFPAFFEALIMEITFEILREAGVRMPKAIGSAISIVGALVIGQAAVQAGIVSPTMVIIVSITAISNFATPSYSMAISTRLIRFFYMVLAAIFGFYGVLLGVIALIVHLCSLRSFGVPYMTPIAPLSIDNLQDTIIRAPFWVKRERANLIMDHSEDLLKESEKPQSANERGMINTSVTDGEDD